MDDNGRVHPFGGAFRPNFPIMIDIMPERWDMLEKVEDQLIRVNRFGGVQWSGDALAGYHLPLVDGGLLIDVEVQPGRGLVALDRFGALYASEGAILPEPQTGPPYFGFEAARDLEIGPPLGR